MRVVVDTNIFVSGLISAGPSRHILDLIETGSFTCVMSPELLRELNETLRRPKFKTLFKTININKILNIVKKSSALIIPSERIKDCRDPKDNMVLATAVAAKANIIVSGDKDLLALNPFRKIAIIPPAKFLAKLNK